MRRSAQKRLPDDYPPAWVHDDIDELRARWVERAVPYALPPAADGGDGDGDGSGPVGSSGGGGGLLLVSLPPYGPEVSRRNKASSGPGGFGVGSRCIIGPSVSPANESADAAPLQPRKVRAAGRCLDNPCSGSRFQKISSGECTMASQPSLEDGVVSGIPSR